MYKQSSVGEGTPVFNTNDGHYFTMFVAIYSNFCIYYSVHGFHNLL